GSCGPRRYPHRVPLRRARGASRSKPSRAAGTRKRKVGRAGGRKRHPARRTYGPALGTGFILSPIPSTGQDSSYLRFLGLDVEDVETSAAPPAVEKDASPRSDPGDAREAEVVPRSQPKHDCGS